MDFFIFGKTFLDFGLFRKIKNLGLAPVTNNSNRETKTRGMIQLLSEREQGIFRVIAPVSG